MVFNATFNNISVILWRSVLLLDETRVPGENNRPVASHWHTLSHNAESSTPHLSVILTHNVSGDRHQSYGSFAINVNHHEDVLCSTLAYKKYSMQAYVKKFVKWFKEHVLSYFVLQFC
jgi:hypothetical protein